MIVCYPTPGKDKARRICEAFAVGAGGTVADRIPGELPIGAVPFFYGVTPATKHLWQQAQDEGQDWYYCDNAYFDSTRELYFRVTKNRLQHDGRGISDGRRLNALGISFLPWREPTSRGHVLVCPQSDEFMRLVADYPGEWINDTVPALKGLTTRKIVVRKWERNKAERRRTLQQDLQGCFALVTWSSAAAIAAIAAGVPAICMAPDCVARPVAGHYLDEIDCPPANLQRMPWAAVVADNQWTLEEMRNGTCWRQLQRSELVNANA